jgi:hypothetical protein
VLSVAALTVFGPGLAVLVALGVRQRLLLLAAAPAASIGVALLVASWCGLAGSRFGPTSLAVGTGVLVVVGVGLSLLVSRFLGRPAALPPPRAKPLLPPLTGMTGLVAQLAGLVFVLTGAGLALRAWSWGIGPWTTYNQDHDTILHSLLVAYIQRSGRGAPWQIMPADVINKTPTVYYPDGFHLIGAIVADVFGNSVVGMNGAAAMLLGAAWTTSAAALAALAVRWLRDDAGWMALGAGAGSVIAAGLYRPGVSLARDNGLLPNASALVLVPGVVTAILLIRPKAWGSALGVALACAGIVSVHPSAGLSVGLSVLAFWVALLFIADGRAMLRAQWSVLLLIGVAAAAMASPVLRGALAVSSRIEAFPPDTAHVPITASMGQVVPLLYGGMFDSRSLVQVWPTALLVIGLGTALVLRRSVPVLVAWATWVVITLLAYRNPTGITAPILGFFYNSVGRVQSHVPLFAPALGTLGMFGVLSALTAGVSALRLPRSVALRRWSGQLLDLLPDPVYDRIPDRLLRQVGSATPRLPEPPAPPARFVRPSSRVIAVVGVLALVAFTVGYIAGPTSRYLRTSALALSQRWSSPQLYRVDAEDVAAADWLAPRVKPGERVMNSPNDGSAWLYVHDGLPIVELSTLGVPNFPYTWQLMKSFRFLNTNADIRRWILRLNIAWVYVDSRAPIIGANGAPQNWTGGGLMTTVPGLRHLGRVPGLILAHVEGSVRIYKVDLDAIRAAPDGP